jgi:dCMP deaminase
MDVISSLHGLKWDLRFLQLAGTVGTWSRDPSTKVGAVVVRRNKTISSLGFNGFPRNVFDDPASYADRKTKYQMTVHAELNAILAAAEKPEGCLLYVDPFPPCVECSKAIIQSGVDWVVSWEPTPDQIERWGESFDASEAMLRQAGVNRVLYPRNLRTNVIDTDAVFAAWSAGQR